ncbi:hypothetical protein GP486_000537 [Trichoglossum hirsutum]|uniref:Uncharacterized protein n=1 Tax=Trichoglossum hirsutum TaxID=265104 RepID=A0A9P8RTW2_9PEZI|nr:hypothetical protein GP486_000537 [Trichoglossum hirsutum]
MAVTERLSRKSSGYNAQTSHNTAEETHRKFLTIPILLLNTVVSTLILVGLENHWVIHGNWYSKIRNARATAQIFVQIIAGLLGAFYVHTICQLLNFYSRISFTQRPMSLDRLKLWNALTTPSIDWSTSIKTLPIVVVFYLATLVPSALWAGALTPIEVSAVHTTSRPIHLPRYSEKSYSFWSQNTFSNSAADVNTQGTFSYVPLRDRFGQLVTDGSAASSVNGDPQLHTKNDNSNYTYIGRSFGVASSVGLADNEIREQYAIGYRYTETGYNSSVECAYNSTSQFELRLVQNGENQPLWQTPYLYLATGPGPNTTRTQGCAAGKLTECGGVITAGLGGDQSIVAGAWWASAESGMAGRGLPRPSDYVGKTRPPFSKSITSLAAGSNYKRLDKVQCSISMIPASFSIDVNTLERTITVTPQSRGSSVADIEPSGFIANSAASIIGFMTLTDATLYSSVLGTMLQSNIDNVQQKHGSSAATAEDTLEGVAECLQVLIDDHLLATASAQLIIAKDIITVPATISYRAFSVGQKAYAITVVVINALVVLAFIVEAVRTWCWRDLPKFNFKDIKSVAIASSLGGYDVGNAVGDAVSARSDWVGDPGDRTAGSVEVMLSLDEGVVLGLPDAKLECPSP